MYIDSKQSSFDVTAYFKGLLGSVVRFGESAIHGKSAKSNQYAGWGINYMGQGKDPNTRKS